MDYLIQKERVELFAPNLTIEVTAEIEGNISEEQLSEAVWKALNGHEILQCKIKVNDQGEAYYSRMDTPKIKMQTFYDDWTSVVAEQQRKAFDLENGELVRFFVKFKEKGVQLLIIAHHLAGDGLGITYLLEDIVNVLNGQELEYKKMNLFELRMIPKGSRLSLMLRLMMKRTNRNWKKTGKVFSFSEYRSMFLKYWESHETKIFYDTLEPNIVERIKAMAKQHEITVNTLLITAFLQAQAKETNIGITVRLTSKNGEIRENQSTAVSVKYDYDETKDFWKNASLVHQNITQKLNQDKDKYFLMQFLASLSPTLIDAAYFAAFDDYDNKVAIAVSDMFGYGEHGKKNMSISNLTNLDFNLVPGKYTLHNIIFVPPVAANAACIVGIVTYQGKMAISYHVPNNDKLMGQKKVFEKALSILKNF